MALGRSLIALAILLAAQGAWAAPTAEQRAELLAVSTLVTRASNLFAAHKYQESATVMKEAQARFEKLAEGADEQMVTQLRPVHQKLIRGYALLELEGISLSPLKPLEATSSATDDGKGSVSFVKQVAPILNTRCGSCHVRNARGMFSMASFESLMTGPPDGKVVIAGNVKGSDLIVKVEDKEMPPNGSGIPDSELATLRKWVEEGAKFDGPDPKAQLTSLLTGQQAAAMPAATVQQATGKESISFAKDIAPILSQSCTGCHGAMRPRANFSLLTIESLLRGGDRGEPVLPGKPADSLLVKKLKGTADGARMPMGRDPLDEATIAKIEKWIEEGAKFDGPNPKQSIIEVAAIAKASGQTHEQLSADRALLAERNWRLGMPGIMANRSESTNFLVLGNVGENTLNEIAERAEALAPKVGAILKAPADQPLIKGRLTLFVFGERYDYGEFGKMVEKRDLPPAWRGHHRYSIVDAYGVVMPSKSDDYSLDALIAQQLAAVYVASQGSGVPTWFAEGTGRVIATRLVDGPDSRIEKWDAAVPQAVAAMRAPDDFLTGKVSDDEAAIASYSFVKFLMAEPRKHQILLDGLREGGQFNAQFAQAYGGTPSQLSVAWVRKPHRPTPRRASSR
jgi:mono/diheme cytochrome c family protein